MNKKLYNKLATENVRAPGSSLNLNKCVDEKYINVTVQILNIKNEI